MIPQGTKDFAISQLFSASLARTLMLIHERGPFMFQNGAWYNPDQKRILNQSITALFNLYLIMVVTEGKHRCRHTVELTEIGELVADNLIQRREQGRNSPTLHLSEKAQRFITQVVS